MKVLSGFLLRIRGEIASKYLINVQLPLPDALGQLHAILHIMISIGEMLSGFE